MEFTNFIVNNFFQK